MINILSIHDASLSLLRRFNKKLREAIHYERQEANYQLEILENMYIEVAMILLWIPKKLITNVRVRCSDVYVIAVGTKEKMWELTIGKKNLFFR